MTAAEFTLVQRLTGFDGDLFAALRQQIRHATVRSREATGVGILVDFDVDTTNAPAVPDLAGAQPVAGGFADAPDLKYGVNLVLWTRDGVLSMLEAATFEEDWPSPDLGRVEITNVHRR